MVWTERRIKTLQEILGGMRVIKYFAWEVCRVSQCFFRIAQVVPGTVYETNR